MKSIDKYFDNQAWESWEEVNKQFNNGINPHAYILGYREGFTADKGLRGVLTKDIELHTKVAAMVMQGLLSNIGFFNPDEKHKMISDEILCERAVKLSRLLLERYEK